MIDKLTQKPYVVRMSGYELPTRVYAAVAQARVERGISWKDMYREALAEWARKRPLQTMEDENNGGDEI
jgi:hypothetical protein